MKSKRTRFIVLIAAVAALAGLYTAKPVWQPVLTAYAVPHMDAPTREAMQTRSRVIDEPVQALLPLWKSDKIPHRLYALRAIRDHWRRNGTLPEELRQVLAQGIFDADQQVQSLVLRMLVRMNHKSLPTGAVPLLSDPDPSIRAEAVRAMRQSGELPWTEVILPLVSDADPRVAAEAASALRKWTGRDFGVRSLSSRAERDRGAKRWNDWWREAQFEFPPSPLMAQALVPPRTIEAPSATVRDLQGTTMEIREHEDERLLVLAFWGDRTAAVPETLAEACDGMADAVRALAVCVDNVPTAPLHGHAHEHEDEHASRAAATSHESALEKRGWRQREPDLAEGVEFVMDNGEAAVVYAAHQLPTYVIVNPRGEVCRRMVGGTSAKTLRRTLDRFLQNPNETDAHPVAFESD